VAQPSKTWPGGAGMVGSGSRSVFVMERASADSASKGSPHRLRTVCLRLTQRAAMARSEGGEGRVQGSCFARFAVVAMRGVRTGCARKWGRTRRLYFSIRPVGGIADGLARRVSAV